MPNSPEKVIDPATTDETNATARDGASERRDPNEPAAVVGLGASAGGIAVLQQFFNDMDPESGLAFVVVMHLSPEHESNLAALIQQKTAMPVTQVHEPVKVKPNHVYVIPPNKQLTFEENTLQLVEPQQALGRRVTIDLFFRTLAHAFGQRAVCVILSGTDSDGVIGLKHVRAQGGLTIAQDPAEAEHDSMPATAIATGMVDWVLPVRQMAPKLMEFVLNVVRMKLPPEDPDAQEPDVKDEGAPGGPTVLQETLDERDEGALADVLTHLRDQTGHDFTHYKRATLLRRIARRLQVNTLETIPEYLELIRASPVEPGSLLQDLLIGVTHFFRDQASFATLEENIPQLFAGKRQGDQIRVWVAGCATGEEAYSIAMLLCEHADRLEAPPSFQIFATDIDDQSIQEAREGSYPATIEADVSPQRLRRFFVKDERSYRVKKDLRDMVLFAAHNLLTNAPFSRLDLVSCRNLLIYLNTHAQEQVFDIFHFSLRSGGMLFIGTAESANNVQPLFSPVDAKHRLFVRRSFPRPLWKIPALPPRLPGPRNMRTSRPSSLPPMARPDVEGAGAATSESNLAGQERRSVLFGELHLELLEHYGPPSVLVNEAHNIVHLSEHAGRYLTFLPGEPSTNLLNVMHPALRVELRTALFRARQTNANVTVPAQSVHVEGETEVIDLHVRPIHPNDSAHGFFLVLFEKTTVPLSPEAQVSRHEDVNRELDDELQFLKEQLHGTVEQYEASSEELKASNEELQAMNEEMRSAAEELETSQEELQSVNEELTTVNHELKDKVDELSQANSDLQNLMHATDVGTIFLDRQMRIKRFTPRVQDVFNLLPSDLGRPISDITHKFAYHGLLDDAGRVLRTLKTIENEVQVGKDSYYLARVSPYRTADDHIAGVVATFIDISERKQSEMELRQSAQALERQTRIFDTTLSSIVDFAYIFDKEGRFVFANKPLADLLQLTPQAMVGKTFFDLGYPPDLAEKLQRQIAEVFETKEIVRDDTPFTSPAGVTGYYEYIFRPLFGLDGSVESVVGSTRNLTERKQAEQALAESEARFRQFAENSADVLWIIDAERRELEYLSPAFEKMWGESRDVVMRDLGSWTELLHPDDREKALTTSARVLAGETVVIDYRIIRPSDGEVRWIRDTSFPVRNKQGAVYRVGGLAQDITLDKNQTEALRESQERFRLLVEGAKDYAMFLLDPGNVITFWSVGAQRIFGWTEEEAIGQPGDLIFTPEDRAQGMVEKEIATALSEGRALDRRWHLRKDGSRFWADGVMMRLDHPNDGGFRGLAKIARDASDQKAAEEALRDARDEMEQRVIERTAELMTTNTELQNEMKQREQLERQLLEISEREKRRIGEDLHDMVCQELTATALLLKSSANKLASESPAASEMLNESAQIVNRNVNLARDLARGLQPAELTAAGLNAALRALAAQASESGEINCQYKSARSVRLRDDTVALHLYRIAQEAVNNAARHSGAKNIVISLEREEGTTCLTVGDDGKGMPKRKKHPGLGVHLMKYRANVLGGTLKINSAPRRGTTITTCLPAGPACPPKIVQPD